MYGMLTNYADCSVARKFFLIKISLCEFIVDVKLESIKCSFDTLMYSYSFVVLTYVKYIFAYVKYVYGRQNLMTYKRKMLKSGLKFERKTMHENNLKKL